MRVVGVSGGPTAGSVGGFVAGLCSVTLRASSPGEVVDVATAAGLAALEWGGDVHVPAGDLSAAAAVAERTTAAGLSVASYGSYLFADPALADDDIGRVVDTAAALGAPWIRVWCPFGVEPGAPADLVAGVAATLARIAVRAVDVGCAAYVEFHGQTLTATEASAAAVLAAAAAACESSVAGPWSAWQPPYWDRTRPTGSVDGASAATGGVEPAARRPAVDDDVVGIGRLAPRLAHLHVYAWDHDGGRAPLASQADAWVRRIRAAAGAGPVDEVGPRLALLEFVPDDEPDAVASEAATLQSVLAAAVAPNEEDRP